MDFTVDDDGKHKEQYVDRPYRHRTRIGISKNNMEETRCAR